MEKGFGFLLRKYREEKGHTQTSFCEALEDAGLHLSQSALSDYERGQKTPLESRILQMVQVLELDAEQRHQLLVAAKKVPKDALKHDVVTSIAVALADPDVPPEIKEKLEEDIDTVRKGWLTFATAQRYNRRRLWKDSIAASNESTTEVSAMASRLAGFLTDARAVANLHLGNISEAEEVFQYGDVPLKGVKDVHLRGTILAHQGDVFRDQGAWDAAEEKYLAAVRVFGKGSLEQTWVNRKLAVINLFRGNWRPAMDDLNVCLFTFEQELNIPYEAAKTHYALGWAYNLSGDWEQAHAHHSTGLQTAYQFRVAKQWPDDYLAMLGHSYMGNDARQVGQFSEALSRYKTALSLASTLEEGRELGWIQLGLARTYAQLGIQKRKEGREATASEHFREAATHFGQAIDANYKANYDYRTMMSRAHYAQYIIAGERDLSRAERELHQARSIANRLQSYYYQAEIAVFLCELYRLKREFATIALLAEDVTRLSSEYGYPQLVAQLRSIQADAEIDLLMSPEGRTSALLSSEEERYSAASDFCALAYVEALRFNEAAVDHVASRCVGTIDRIRGSRGIVQARDFCLTVANNLHIYLENRRGIDSERRLQALKRIQDLEDNADRLEDRIPLI